MTDQHQSPAGAFVESPQGARGFLEGDPALPPLGPSGGTHCTTWSVLIGQLGFSAGDFLPCSTALVTDNYNVISVDDFPGESNDNLSVILPELRGITGGVREWGGCSGPAHWSVTATGSPSGAKVSSGAYVSNATTGNEYGDTGDLAGDAKNVLVNSRHRNLQAGGRITQSTYEYTYVYPGGFNPFASDTSISFTVSGLGTDWPAWDDIDPSSSYEDMATIDPLMDIDGQTFSNTTFPSTWVIGNMDVGGMRYDTIDFDVDHSTPFTDLEQLNFDPFKFKFEASSGFVLGSNGADGAEYAVDDNGLQWYAMRDVENTTAARGCITIWAFEATVSGSNITHVIYHYVTVSTSPPVVDSLTTREVGSGSWVPP